MAALARSVQIPRTESLIPRPGFGVYRLYEDECEQSCIVALRHTYRHIDSAQLYRNETAVRAALIASEVEREEMFLTTKIGRSRGSIEKTYDAALDSVVKLGGLGGYVNLFLVHIPGRSREFREELWLALEQLYHQGKARAIGVSNYHTSHLEEMKQYATVWPPHVNQIEVCFLGAPSTTKNRGKGKLSHTSTNHCRKLHPWCQQRKLVKYCHDNDIIIEAYSPLSAGKNLMDPDLSSIASKHAKSPAQVLIRWSLQKGWVPLVKSRTPDRIEENVDVFAFELDSQDMQRLDKLDQGSVGAQFPANVSN